MHKSKYYMSPDPFLHLAMLDHYYDIGAKNSVKISPYIGADVWNAGCIFA